MTNGVHEFFAKLFYVGPILGQSTGKLITISGQVQPNQVRAQAAGLVPVVTRDGRYVPADGNGKESPVLVVANLADVPSDSDGWFMLGADARWWKGVEGVLMVLIYDTDLRGGAFFANLRTLAFTAHRRATARFITAPQPVSPVPAPLQDARKAMCSAMESFLRGKTTSDLKGSVVRIRR